MTIREVEEQTGLARSNVRFYEKEKLIFPSRNQNNGYRDYSGEDVDNIRKIAYLRTLGISIEDIRGIIAGEHSLYDVVDRQSKALDGQFAELKQAKLMCEKMLLDGQISFESLRVEAYVTEMQDYWEDNRPVLQLDAVSFLQLWGSFFTWILLTLLCVTVGILAYAKLPPKLPVQWSGGEAVSLVNKNFIFAYPAFCVIVRMLVRPYLSIYLQMRSGFADIITEYLTNYLCFLALSVEVFSVLFVYGVTENVVGLLLVDTVVFAGLLIMGVIKMRRKSSMR